MYKTIHTPPNIGLRTSDKARLLQGGIPAKDFCGAFVCCFVCLLRIPWISHFLNSSVPLACTQPSWSVLLVRVQSNTPFIHPRGTHRGTQYQLYFCVAPAIILTMQWIMQTQLHRMHVFSIRIEGSYKPETFRAAIVKIETPTISNSTNLHWPWSARGGRRIKGHDSLRLFLFLDRRN